jgi:hypothetical protein
MVKEAFLLGATLQLVQRHSVNGGCGWETTAVAVVNCSQLRRAVASQRHLRRDKDAQRECGGLGVKEFGGWCLFVCVAAKPSQVNRARQTSEPTQGRRD